MNKKLLKIKTPNLCQSEQRYVLDILLGEFLGLAFEVESYEGDVIEITRPGGAGAGLDDYAPNAAKLTIDASFFHKAHKAWLKHESMPVLPLATWNPAEEGINANLVEPIVPVLYGHPGRVKNAEHHHLNLDIFGSAFFMLSRYEELITKDLDNHDRFPAWASVAFKANFLDRPIVNEYLEILWQCLQQLWPDLERNERKFRKLISCDVDHPFDLVGYSLKRTILRVGARLFRDKSMRLALFDGLNYIFKKFGSDRFDEYRNNIDWMMKVNDEAGNRVAFNFIPIQTDKNREDSNDIRHPKILALLKHIVVSGHEIGFHPGYQTCNHPENFKQSANVFKRVLENELISLNKIGGRQHYLKYNVITTPQLWQEYGFDYDSSLGFEDKAGFRCGVCYEYSMFDLLQRKKILLKQRQLIVMECAIIEKANEGLGYGEKSYYRFEYFKSVCKQFNGDYSLLWHNSYFINEKLKRLYENVIK